MITLLFIINMYLNGQIQLLIEFAIKVHNKSEIILVQILIKLIYCTAKMYKKLF